MRRFAVADILAALSLLDAELPQPAVMVVIGGAAVALGHVPSHATSDVDLWRDPGPEFWWAVERCRGSFPPGFAIQLAGAVSSPPINFEDRLRPFPGGTFERLTLLLPDAHDLAILKIGRGEVHDYQAIEDIHSVTPLSLVTLLERYQEALTQVIVPPRRFRLNFLALLARLFGEDTADGVAGAIDG